MASSRTNRNIARYRGRVEKNSAKALEKELEREFRQLAVESESELLAVAKDAEQRMKVTVWRDTDGERSPASKKYGPISSTIDVREGRDERGFYVDFTVGAFYSSFQEYGTVHIPPRPRFRPAVQQAIVRFKSGK